jgi:Ribosomal protein L1p/L10e family
MKQNVYYVPLMISFLLMTVSCLFFQNFLEKNSIKRKSTLSATCFSLMSLFLCLGFQPQLIWHRQKSLKRKLKLLLVVLIYFWLLDHASTDFYEDVLYSVFCRTIKIAVASQNHNQIVENIMSSIPDIVSHFPKKWKNVQSIHVKSARSLAVPLYHVLLKEPPQH